MNNFKLIVATFLFSLFLGIQSLEAVPAYPHPVEYTLPDGSSITIQLRGDEHVNWAESADGYTLLRNNSGYFEYAKKDISGDLILSGVQAKNIAKRSNSDNVFLRQTPQQLTYSTSQAEAFMQVQRARAQATENIQRATQQTTITGLVRAPLILVQFPGKLFTKTQTDFNLLCNQTGYNVGTATGSVNDYFKATSYNQLDFQVDVFGPFTMPLSISAYDDESGGDPRLMAAAAANAAAAAGCDFSNYDIDNNGVVDGIHIIYAGYDQSAGAPSGSSIWAHAWTVSGNLTLNGKRVSRYSCSSELRGTSGTTITPIGVIAHELSHVFGLPDLYDTDYASSGGTSVHMGQWDIMASGSWNNNGDTPPYHSAWCKEQLGWITTVELNTPADITLPDPATQGVAYRINTSTANEYFLVENRQKQSWDAYIPGSGMLIYHVDENRMAAAGNALNANPSYRGLYVKQAGCGVGSNCSNNRDRDPYPYGTNNSFTDSSIPNSLSWAGNYTYKPITEIVHNTGSKIVTFKFMGGATNCPLPSDVTVSNIYSSEATLGWTAGGSETQWVVSYKKQSDATWNADIYTNIPSYLLNGLESNTTYEIKVRAICEANDTSFYQAKTFTTTPCDNMCTYTLIANDSFGDGWNSASLVLKQNGVEVGTFTAIDHGLRSVATSDTLSVALCSFVAAEMYFVSGDYDYEISFVLKDESGNVVYSTTNAYGLSSTISLVDFVPCEDTCPVPTNFQINTVTTNSVSASWQGVGGESSWIISIEDTGIVETDTVFTNSYIYAGLQPSTRYTIKLNADCNGVLSNLYQANFTTFDIEPMVTTLAATEITFNSATLNKELIVGSLPIDTAYFLYKKASEDNWLTSTDGILTALVPNVEYQYFYSVETVNNIYRGDTLAFTTMSVPLTVETLSASDVEVKTAILNGTFETSDDAVAIVEQGYKYRKITDSYWIISPTGILTALEGNSTYQFLAYAKTGSFEANGDILQFTTLSYVAPVVTTLDATNINGNTVMLHKSVVVGNETILAEGFEIRVVGDEQWDNTVDSLLQLLPNTNFEFRAYAETASGVVYGEVLMFSTLLSSLADMLTEGSVLYPNPASDKVRLKLNGFLSNKTVSIFDMQGRTIVNMEVGAKTNELEIDLSDFADGSFVVRIVSDNNIEIKKLMVKRK